MYDIGGHIMSFIFFPFLNINTLRKLAKAMIKRCDAEKVKKDGELLPGGDIRCHGNQWVRASYESSGIQRCPRENATRLCIQKVAYRKHLRFRLSLLKLCTTMHLLCHAVSLFVCACALSFFFGLCLAICLQRFWED